VEGSEMCGVDSLGLDVDHISTSTSEDHPETNRMQGLWFEVLRSNRVTSLNHESTVIHWDISDGARRGQAKVHSAWHDG